MAAPGVSRPRHFPCFDGLRAFAAMSVVVIHTAFVSGFTTGTSEGIYTARLEIGVAVFFLISGFLLYRPFAVSHVTGRASPALGRFWARRLLRILPAYWLALTVTNYVLHANNEGHGWGAVAAQYGFAQIYFPSKVFTGITQAWSLCTEMSYYLFLPLLAAVLVARRRSAGNQLARELAMVATLFATSVVFRDWAYHQRGHLAGTMADWLPANLDLFALGMLLAVLSAWYTHERTEPRWLSHPLVPWASWAAAGAMFFWVSHLGIPRVPIYVISPGLNLLRQTLYGLFAFFLLVPAVFGPQHRGAIRWLLRFPPVVGVGVVSYGVYLWHQAWVSEFLVWTGDRLFDIPLWQLFLAVSAVAVAVAAASYLLFERPILRLKGRLSWWGRRAPDPGFPPGTPAPVPGADLELPAPVSAG